MKKHFINFLKAFCVYDEFMEAFIASNKYFDFTYFLKYTDPSLYLVGAFPPSNNPFTPIENYKLIKEWQNRLHQINHESNN